MSSRPRVFCPSCGKPVSEMVPVRAELRRRDDQLMARVILIQLTILIAVLTDLAFRVA